MKNLLESFAVFMVGILSLLIVYLIVQYNMIEEEATDETVLSAPVKAKEKKQAKTQSYLDSLEGYGGDVDVKVDATKEHLVNVVAVTSEEANDELGKAVEDKTKSSYMENLENYSEPEVDAKKPAKKEVVKTEVKDPNEPEKLPQDEIEDEIGMAIDAALDDL